MKMSEMVEKVAKAILFALENESSAAVIGNIYGVSVHGEIDARRLASAAIVAMREPTDEMADAGADAVASDGISYSLEPGEGIDGYDSVPVWQAMIDAALNPPAQKG